MNKKEIPEKTIDLIAQHINNRVNKPPELSSTTTVEGKTETPHYYEIIPFDEIDNSDRTFYAIDGSYNSQDFFNGLTIGVYTAGYIAYHKGKQVKLNNLDDPIILGKSYYPNNILITNDEHKYAVFEELLEMKPVKKLFKECFEETDYSKVLAFKLETILSKNVSGILSFAQEILEWSMIWEIANLERIKKGDFILRDGTLRSNNIKQEYLIKLGKKLHEKGIFIVAITKNSPIKLELSSTYKKIDNYLETEKKPKYPFRTTNPLRQKLCVWFEVPDNVLVLSYPDRDERIKLAKKEIDKITKTSMFAKKGLTGGRGFGIFFSARLDYVEKLQNYDWVVADLNIFDCINDPYNNFKQRNFENIELIFNELTRLTQEHYILGYPYPLVEAHNFVTLKDSFKDEIVKRVKASLYKTQMMDNVDIENLFLDIHERF